MTDMFIARVLNPNRRYARMSVVRIGVLEATASNEAAITVNLGDRFALLHLKEARVLQERITTAIIAVTGGGEPDRVRTRGSSCGFASQRRSARRNGA